MLSVDYQELTREVDINKLTKENYMNSACYSGSWWYNAQHLPELTQNTGNITFTICPQDLFTISEKNSRCTKMQLLYKRS